jgi:undecaprenyl diphosphate synthase
MDGNGRWAENKGLPRYEGHRAGVNSVKTIVRACLQKNIPILSLFAFSSENWGRPEAEVEFLMQLFIQALAQELAELKQHGVALRFVGCRRALSKTLQQEMQQAETSTAMNDSLLLNVVINYGGRWDITQAVREIVNLALTDNLSPEDIDESLLAKHLSTHGVTDPDLFIRTGGEQRISNFFLWQMAYTELYFSPVFWPDFTSQEFEKALESFTQRERRYGKISLQSGEANHV